MSRNSTWLILLFCGMASTIWGQCISDDCGDIVAKFVLNSQQTVVCEGTPFSVRNLTDESDIDFYVFDWGDGTRDTVTNTASLTHSYKESDEDACLTGATYYEITLEIQRTCGTEKSCHFQRTGVLVKYVPRVKFVPGIACAGEETNFSVEICNADSVHWSFGDGNTSSDPSPQHTYDEPGEYWAVVEVFNDCGMDIDSGLIRVTPAPDAEIELTPEQLNGCAPHTFTINNNTSQKLEYDWSVSPSAGVEFVGNTDDTSREPRLRFEQAGTYILTLRTKNECGRATRRDTIRVFDPPTAALIPVDPFCQSATFTPSANYVDQERISRVTWTFVNGQPGQSRGFDPGPVRFDQSGQVIIRADSECGAFRDTMDVTVEIPIAVTISAPDEPLCTASDPVQLTAVPEGGVWSGPSISSNGRFNPQQAGVGTHTLTYRLENACGGEQSIDLEVRAAADVDVQDRLRLCESAEPVQLTFSPTGGVWKGPGIVDAANGVFDPAVSGPGSFELNYEYADAIGCTVSKNTDVVIQALPSMNAPDTATSCLYPGRFQLLPDSDLNLQPAGGTLTWSGPGVVDSVEGIFDADAAGASGFGVYPISVSYRVRQCVVTDEFLLTVKEPPQVEAIDDRRVCLDREEILLTATPAGGRWRGPGIKNNGLINLRAIGEGAFQYIYRYREGTTCQAEDTVQVSVADLTKAAAGDDVTICQDSPIFEMAPATPAGGIWTGPGVIDGQSGRIDPSALEPGVHVLVYQIAEPGLDCSANDTVLVEVKPKPSGLFGPEESLCVNTPITFVSAYKGQGTFQWDFGDGTTATGDTVVRSFAEGTYRVRLDIETPFGCQGSRFQDIVIAGPPRLDFTPDIGEGCAPLMVGFDNDSRGANLRYEWDFGNGRVSNKEVPDSVLYEPMGLDSQFVVTLRAYNGCGEQTIKDTIRLQGVPEAIFATQVDDGCAPLEISFANASTGIPDTYQWDLGNGNFSVDFLPRPQIYEGDPEGNKEYYLSLTVANKCGTDTAFDTIVVQPPEVRAFISLDTARGCVPLTLEFENFATPGANVNWEFGDGGTSAAPDAIHTFDSAGIFTIRQIAENGCSSDTAQVQIEIFPKPQIAMEVPTTACLGDSIRFSNRSPTAITTLWDFGDGTTSNRRNPNHRYDSAGTYTVRMLIYDANSDCPAEDSTTITILPRPDAALEADVLNGCPPLQVCFTNLSTDAQSFEWNFGDGNTSSDVAPCHVFTEPGRHRVRLRGVDPNGCFSDSATVEVLVYDAPIAAVAPVDPLNCGLPDTLRLEDQTQGGTDYFWTVSDGQLSDLTNPTFIFEQEGTVDIQLVVTNSFGCADTTSLQRTSQIGPIADFNLPNGSGCAPVTVQFENLSENADSYQWVFGNRTTSTEFEPTVTFDRAGAYSARLIASYQNTCFDTLDLASSVEILPSPEAAFTWTELPDDPGTIVFRNLSTNALGYEWDFGDGFFSEEENPTHSFTRNAEGQVVWEVKLMAYNDNSCIDTALAEVAPEPLFALHFPNAFSPETGRGDVRVFKPAGLGIEEWHLQIYTPWGELVWESEALEGGQPAAAWDGTHRRTGKLLPQGAYAYQATVLFLNGVRKYYKGSVTLLR